MSNCPNPLEKSHLQTPGRADRPETSDDRLDPAPPNPQLSARFGGGDG